MAENSIPSRKPKQLALVDLFVADLTSWPVKDDMASMDVPIFSLSRHGDLKIRKYQRGNKSLTITPSVLGAATVFDKDLLLFVVSQIIQAQNEGKPVSRTVEVNSFDYLTATARSDGGKSFDGIIDTLRRLKGTNLETNIATGNVQQIEGFGLIEDYKILIEKKRTEKKVSKKGKNDNVEITRVHKFQITISNWLMNGLADWQVKTIDRAYFELDKPIDRRLYEIGKWHCRDQALWKISTALLAEKVGTNGVLSKFRASVRDAIKRQPLPEYNIALDAAADMVVFYTKDTPALSMYLIKSTIINWFETLER